MVTTPGTDHVCSQRVLQGQSRAHGWEWQCTACTLRLDHGLVGLGKGLRRRHRQRRHQLRAESAAWARAVEAQARGSDCCARLCVATVGSSDYGRQGTEHSTASQGSAMRAGHGHGRGSWSGGRARQWRLEGGGGGGGW